MAVFTSNYSQSELIERWDDYTSISRFAGCDDTMDLIFCSKRNGDRVKLVRKARAAKEPFMVVFRGNIKKTEAGSKITGLFTKSIADYILIAVVLTIVFAMRYYAGVRNVNLTTANTLLVCAIVLSLLALICRRKTKRKYEEFISRITGIDNGIYLSKREAKNKD